MTRNIRFTTLALIVLVALGGATILADDPPAKSQPAGMMGMHGSMMNGGNSDDPTMMDCKGMMAKHEAMQEQMKVMDARLDGLVSDMNAASGQAKVEKMASVINELVAQRSKMRDGMMGMHSQMMSHMMAHMQGGMMKAGEAMSSCPMMGAMKDGPEDHSQHH